MMTNNNRIELKKWKFCLDQTGYGEGSGWAGKYYDDSGWAEVETCTCWETLEHAMRDYEGRGWFRTRFTPLEQNRNYILHFEGIGGTAKVFVNGRYMGGTDNRYLPFDVDITLAVWTGGENVVAVLVDNRFRGPQHLPGGANIEWVLYGGLNHRVWMEEVPKSLHLQHLHVDASADKTAKITAGLVNMMAPKTSEGPGIKFEGSITAEIEEMPECTVTKEVLCTTAMGETKTVLELTAENAELWSPESPNLYTLKVTLRNAKGKVVEEATERIGFRTISTKGTKILLNGKEIFLNGANRYDEYYPYGNCPPEEAIREDFLAMKKVGINLIRTHYPQDPIHYRLADELGLMYMIEVPVNWWNPTAEETLADHIGLASEAMECLENTFYWHCNHPCWTIWSTGNECAHSEPAAVELFHMMGKRMKELGSKALVTYAANKLIRNSTELDFCDVISINAYTGILSETVEEMDAKITPSQRTDLALEFYPDKPHMMSEYGYICVAGMHNSPECGRYAEDLGEAFLEKTIAKLMEDPNMRGLVIWCWADYRHQRHFLTPLRGMGLQAIYGPWGLVTIDRKPKEGLLKAFEKATGKYLKGKGKKK